MFEWSVFLAIVYILIVGVLAFVIIYPAFKDFSRDFFTSKGSADVAAFCMALMAIGGAAFILMFFMITAFVAMLFVIISIFSGFELIYWTKAYKINLMLFIISVALSAVSFVTGRAIPMVYLVQGGIYLVGVAEGANKHLLPIAKDIYADFGSESYAEVFVALCVILCFFSVSLPFFGVDVPYAQTSRVFSDVGFLAGGLMAYYVGQLLRKKDHYRNLH